MDFNDNNYDQQNSDNQHQPVEPIAEPQQAPIPQPMQCQPSPKKGGFWRIICRIFFSLSIITNIFLFLAVVAMAAFFATGMQTSENYQEKIVAKGTGPDKIAVISITGIINGEVSQSVKTQIDQAKKDPAVKSLIIRTSTPGGGVGASDRIYHQIKKFRKNTGKPVVAFMQTQATSGGYYTSAACDHIIAEPTAITGSIGVITNHFVVKQLLEEKLGITPVTVKSGPRKAWPNPFIESTPEQTEYLQEKLIKPAYERFVKIVADGRENVLTESQVRVLADGSIYGASEALNNRLIDQIGYMEDAIKIASKLAGIQSPHVIEYSEIFSFAKIFDAQAAAPFTIDRNTIQQFTAPELMYLWTIDQ